MVPLRAALEYHGVYSNAARGGRSWNIVRIVVPHMTRAVGSASSAALRGNPPLERRVLLRYRPLRYPCRAMATWRRSHRFHRLREHRRRHPTMVLPHSQRMRAMPAPPTVPAGNSATPPANPTGSAAAQPSAKRPRMKLIAAIIAVLVVLAGTGFGLAARKLEWIGPRTVPTVRYRTAAEVSRELETKGFLVKKKQTFNALGKGQVPRSGRSQGGRPSAQGARR